MPEASQGRRSRGAPMKAAPMSDTLPGAMVGCPLAGGATSGRVHEMVKEPSGSTLLAVTCDSCRARHCGTRCASV